MSEKLKQRLLQRFEGEFEQTLAEWKELLAFQSVSGVKEYLDDCHSCANWLVEYLQGMGFSSEIRDTPGLPAVIAKREQDPAAPTILFYGHYDVQPPEPLDKWQSPPFEPQLRDSKIYARGAVDNKGQFFYVLKAIQALIAEDSLPWNLKIILEGEEESGSAGLSQMVDKWADDLKADVLMVCDTSTVDESKGTIAMGLRGMVDYSFIVHGPNKDLHSGLHGGVCPNPALIAAKIVAGLHDEGGRVVIPGFYDGVTEPSEAEKKEMEANPIDPQRYQQEIGIAPSGGEEGRSANERMGFRPTVEVNGIGSGYFGEGAKTIIPSYAKVNLTCRLVGGQDPDNVLSLLNQYFNGLDIAPCRLQPVDQGAHGPALKLNPDSSLVKRAREVLAEVVDGGTVLSWFGGSIPVISNLAKATGSEPLMVGFCLEENNMHAPNESFSIDQFRRGYLYAGLFLSELVESVE